MRDHSAAHYESEAKRVWNAARSASNAEGKAGLLQIAEFYAKFAMWLARIQPT
jgi:hypothetical protein